MQDSPYGATPPAAAPWPPHAPPAPATRPSRWPTYAALTLALIAVGLAIAGWLRPQRAETAPPVSYTPQEIQDAKAAVCQAWDKVNRALVTVTRKNGGSDPTAALLVAVNARLAIHAGSQYLQDALAQAPATPVDLADSVRSLTSTYLQMAIDQLGEVPESDLQPLIEDANKATDGITRSCK